MADARLVVLISGRGTNLQAVLDACASGRLPAQVVRVISNRAGAGGLARAAARGVPTTTRCWRRDAQPRARYDRDVAELIAAERPDLVILAGWMHILGAPFVERFAGRVLNLHPALPGAFPGLNAIARAHAAAHTDGLTETGVMVHEVVAAVDAGPVIAEERVPLLAGEPLAELQARIHEVEHRLLVEAIARKLA